MQEERIYKCWDLGLERTDDDNVLSVIRTRAADAPSSSSAGPSTAVEDEAANRSGVVDDPPKKIKATPKAKTIKQQAKSAPCPHEFDLQVLYYTFCTQYITIH